MSLRIVQSSRYIGNDFWSWSVKLEGSPVELEGVKEVVWYLHPSFSPPMVKTRDRSTNFALETTGWGTFELEATLALHSGVDLHLRHQLELFYPDDNAKPKKATRKTSPTKRVASKKQSLTKKSIFLSYQAKDSRQVAVLALALANRGITVLDQQGIPAGVPFSKSIEDLIERSDAMVALVTDEFPSRHMISELYSASSRNKPTLVIKDPKVENFQDSNLTSFGLGSFSQLTISIDDTRLLTGEIEGFIQQP
jgi:TIR domain/YEATS family